jgi:hypothetical protein
MENNKFQSYKVTLTRGKKATFHDTTDAISKVEDKHKKITVAVPDGLKPGDIMNCEDEDGETTRVSTNSP